jgi:subtilisin family serine protease
VGTLRPRPAAILAALTVVTTTGAAAAAPPAGPWVRGLYDTQRLTGTPVALPSVPLGPRAAVTPASREPLRTRSGRLRLVVRPRVPAAPGADPTPWNVTSGALSDTADDPRYRYAEPLYAVRPARVPDDPLFASQPPIWNAFGDDSLRAAWEVTTGPSAAGSRLPVVAVVDTGVQLDHPDLKANLWSNPGEQPGNGRDDDANGYVDDIHGVDVLTGGSPVDADGHGTAVAGILAARGNNGTGVAGALWQARLMAVRVTGADGAGTTADLAAGIRYAARMGAQVINVSMTTSTETRVVNDAIREAADRGALVVAAAGNEGSGTSCWPAASADPHVLSVGAVEDDGDLADFSNYGDRVRITAPGVALATTARGGDYGDFTGTSAASPLVAGSAALLLSAQPRADVVQIREILLRTAGSAKGLRGSGGPLRPVRAMDLATPIDLVADLRERAPYLEIKVKISKPGNGKRRFTTTWRLRNPAQKVAKLRFNVHQNSPTGKLINRYAKTVNATKGKLPTTNRKKTKRKKVRLAMVARATAKSGLLLGETRVYLSIK